MTERSLHPEHYRFDDRRLFDLADELGEMKRQEEVQRKVDEHAGLYGIGATVGEVK